jgi:hypothetical protein
MTSTLVPCTHQQRQPASHRSTNKEIECIKILQQFAAGCRDGEDKPWKVVIKKIPETTWPKLAAMSIPPSSENCIFKLDKGLNISKWKVVPDKGIFS